MKRIRNKKQFLKTSLIALLLLISIGYALLNANLTINGTSNFARTTWNIHFENLVPNTNMTLGQNDSAAAITQNKTNEVTYALSFNEPGQFYEFTVDAKNDGTIDGMVNAVTSTLKIGNGNATPITTNPSNLPAYLSYTATYSDGLPIEQYHLLAANTKETYKVRIEFRTDIDPTDLPGADQTIEFTFGVEYVQADNTAVEVVHGLTGTRYTTYIYDSSEEGYNGVWLNQTKPNGITFHESVSAAKNAFNNRPIYLKHELENDIVKESYVCFEKDSNTYCLRGFQTYDEDAGEYIPEYYDSEKGSGISPYYESNKTILKQAFGESNCTDYSSDLLCSVGLLSANADEDGNVGVYVGDDSANCYVYDNGYSGCIEG